MGCAVIFRIFFVDEARIMLVVLDQKAAQGQRRHCSVVAVGSLKRVSMFAIGCCWQANKIRMGNKWFALDHAGVYYVNQVRRKLGSRF